MMEPPLNPEQDSTEVTPMRDVIERYYQSSLSQLTTHAEREALDTFYQRIKLVEDTDAVVKAYYAERDQFATHAERDAISDFCQGICSYDEPYDYDEDDYEPMPHELDYPAFYTEQYLPDESFLHGTGYVVLPPSEDDGLTAVATAICEQSAEDEDVGWASDLPLTEAEFELVVQHFACIMPSLGVLAHSLVYEAMYESSDKAAFVALNDAKAYFAEHPEVKQAAE